MSLHGFTEPHGHAIADRSHIDTDVDQGSGQALPTVGEPAGEPQRHGRRHTQGLAYLECDGEGKNRGRGDRATDTASVALNACEIALGDDVVEPASVYAKCLGNDRGAVGSQIILRGKITFSDMRSDKRRSTQRRQMGSGVPQQARPSPAVIMQNAVAHNVNGFHTQCVKPLPRLFPFSQ